MLPSCLAVHHPMDATEPGFDFWEWRQARRLIIDQIRAIAPMSRDGHTATLLDIATALEKERLEPGHVEALERALSVRVPSMAYLTETLAGVQRPGAIPLRGRTPSPIIEPDWDLISPTRAMFVGTVNGVPVRARLPETEQGVPEYSVVWLRADGSPNPTGPIEMGGMGPYLSYAKPVWDWLFARHLTLICAIGLGVWPDPAAPPLVLPVDLKPLRRGSI